MLRVAKVAAATTVVTGLIASSAWGAVTPGWECIPTTAGQTVVSGGTGGAPSCGSGKTPVLAPTYVSSGVGGKPTVVFSAVNVQVVSGSGSTNGALNGKGNLIVGYAENSQGYAQSGSNDLVVGADNGWKSFGDIVGGWKNQVLGHFAVALGTRNIAQGDQSSVLAGAYNLASDPYASVISGCENLAGSGSPLSGSCPSGGAEAVLGGFENTASGTESTVGGGEVDDASGGAASVGGGQFNNASGDGASISGGDENQAGGSFASISGGFFNTATTFDASVSGGESNAAQAMGASVLGGDGNTASTNCQSIPASPGTC
jgi:hypothetical protein